MAAKFRTQVYLEPGQHAAILREARRLGISFAAVVRRLVEESLIGKGRAEDPSPETRRKAALSLIGLGRSGATDVSERVAAYLGEAVRAGLERKARRPKRR